jgi:hypothetical protein
MLFAACCGWAYELANKVMASFDGFSLNAVEM